jgi:hypothetical protein
VIIYYRFVGHLARLFPLVFSYTTSLIDVSFFRRPLKAWLIAFRDLVLDSNGMQNERFAGHRVVLSFLEARYVSLKYHRSTAGAMRA